VDEPGLRRRELAGARGIAGAGRPARRVPAQGAHSADRLAAGGAGGGLVRAGAAHAVQARGGGMSVLMVCLLLAGLCAGLMLGFPVAFTLGGVALLFAGLGIALGVFDPAFLQAFP